MMHMADVVRAIAEHRGDAIVIPGRSGRYWAPISDTVFDLPLGDPAMGGHAGFGLGVALAQPQRRVFALEGDGSILMHLGSLATVAARAQQNLAVVIMDNGTYQITGGQATLTDQGADIVAIARGAGLAQSAWAADESAFEELVALALHEDGPWLIGCRIDHDKPKETTERDPARIRDQFMRGLGVKK